MSVPAIDDRTAQRRALDAQIAAEPPLAPPGLEPGASPAPLEVFLPRKRPVAVAGIVQNGVVRPIDPAVQLAEHSRVIIVAAE